LSQLIDPELFRRAKPGSAEDMRNMLHPDLKTIRMAVSKALAAEISKALLPLGYERKGNNWRKASHFGRSILQIQKSTYGFGLFINVGTLSVIESKIPFYLYGAPDRFVLKRFGAFCPELPQIDYDTGEFHYVKLHEDMAFRDAVMTVILTRLIPWIEARHKLLSLFSLPNPKDMAKAPLFRMR
jgi:Domain of unknown function (DUF4304)